MEGAGLQEKVSQCAFTLGKKGGRRLFLWRAHLLVQHLAEPRIVQLDVDVLVKRAADPALLGVGGAAIFMPPFLFWMENHELSIQGT